MRYTIIVIAFLCGTYALSPTTGRASSVRFAPDLRLCFCGTLKTPKEFAVFGYVVHRNETYLVVEKGYGSTAPPPGSKLQINQSHRSGPGGLGLLRSPNRYSPNATFFLEENQTIRYIGVPESGWNELDTFEEHCIERRHIDDVLTFFEDIEFDVRRCYDEITDALGIPKPWTPPDDGCHGGPTGTALLGTLLLLMRRRNGRR